MNEPISRMLTNLSFADAILYKCEDNLENNSIPIAIAVLEWLQGRIVLALNELKKEE